ncbi:MAG: DegT/DnrJ/EryC1/StrS family aminotransferase [Ignavibacteriales bacterium]|nr:DegT/DnrJ/EryC1/StrS family aminotransferase [Ignavibacteriales bacterium]
MIEYENLGKLNAPFFEDYKKAFDAVLSGGWYILGGAVKNFEYEFGHYVGSSHCIGVGNCLDGLVFALKALKLPAGSEIIVPSNTYIATILAVLHAGLVPVLVEPDIRTYTIDPKRIPEAITAKTGALLVVHLYGKSCDMDPILATAQTHGLAVIEDCAQSHGARYKGRMTGTFGIGAFSFYPTKNLGALGDGGAITTGDERIATAVRRLRNYGSDIKYHNEVVGHNSRLDEVQAAFLSVKLRRLDEINAHKQSLARLYLDGLKEDFVLPAVDADYFDVYHIFNVRHPRRDALKDHLLKNEIKTDVHYPIAPHKQKAMQGILSGSYPISEEIHATTLSLPISFFHTESEVRRVIDAMNSF